MRESPCWARSLPFSHIITEIDLSFPSAPARAPSQLRDTTFEMHVCFPFETYTSLLIKPCAALTCCISFQRKISSNLPSDHRHVVLLTRPPSFPFDSCNYWKGQGRAGSPASSCALPRDRGGPSPSRQTGRKCKRIRKTVSEVTSFCAYESPKAPALDMPSY